MLGAPTDDQVDIGSSNGMVEAQRRGEDIAQTVRRRYNDGGAGVSSSVGGPAVPVWASSSRAAAGTTMASDKALLKVRAARK